MSEIARSQRQITLYIINDSVHAEETLVYAKASGLKVKVVDITKNKLTGTQIVEIANDLGCEVAELVNQDHSAYAKTYEPADLSTDDWIKMIRHNPQIMKQPIAIHGDKTVLIETPTDILKV